jgi:MFS family permease
MIDMQMQPAAAPWWVNRNFALFAVGQGISSIGDAVCGTTLVLTVVTTVAKGQTWGPIAVSGLLAAQIVPLFLVRPLAGVWVDRWNARMTMIRVDALRLAALVALLIGLSMFDTASPLFLFTALACSALLISIGSQVFNPAEMKLLAEVVPASQRAHASGINLMLSEFATVIGPALAGATFIAFGVRGALLLDGASFLISLASLALLHGTQQAPISTLRASFHAEWRAGITIFRQQRPLVIVALTLACAMFGIGALNSLNIFFITQTLHASTAAFGWITAAFSLGSILGGALSTRLVPHLGLGRAFAGSMLAVGICIASYAWSPNLPNALALFGLMGVPNALNNVASGPLVLQETPTAYIGRIFSLLTPLWSGIYLVSVLLSGIAYSYLNGGQHTDHIPLLRLMFTLTGIIVVIAGIFAWKELAPLQRTKEEEAGEQHIKMG